MPDFIGGRTRTRTLDPLIKSQHNIFDPAKNFSQLAAKCVVANQMVAANFPTEKWITQSLLSGGIFFFLINVLPHSVVVRETRHRRKLALDFVKSGDLWVA